MLIGIISDTHGDVYGCRAALRMFESLGVERVLHCGDIGSAEIVELFSAWPTHFVFGNVDSPKYLGEAIRSAGQICHDHFGAIQLDNRGIALLHGHDGRLLDKSMRSGQWDVVCHGHTHIARSVTVGSTLIVNPGAVARSASPSVAVVDLANLQVEAVRL